MSKIQILNENIANQIAAGEVVERPASVIKEVLENSIDAGADHIKLDLEEGGLSKIIVTDNGEGMSPEDAVLCFSRHATSKIRETGDLDAIKTFGFRGEALAAISSVSKVSLFTRRKEDDSATLVEIEGGQIKYVGSSKGNVGTRIEIKDLFYNTPARLKFLRSQRVEASQVEDVVSDVCLAQPQVTFSYRSENKPKIDAFGVPKDVSIGDVRLLERVTSLMGEECRGKLFPFDEQLNQLRLVGYVASPLVSRRDNRGIKLFVNGRVIKDRNLSMAVQIAYRTLLEVGRKPICSLNIIVDPHLVDVNVHPQKSEVRFQESLNLQSQMIRSLQGFLATTPWLNANIGPKKYTLSSSFSSSEPPSVAREEHRSYVSSEFIPVSGQIGWNILPIREPEIQQVQMEPARKRFFHELKVLGQVDQTYLVLDDGERLVLVDQHAAHERVWFERLRQEFAQKKLVGQPLLFPKQLKLSDSQIAALEEQRGFLSQFGFEVDQFGPDTAILRSLPPSLKEKEAEEMLRDFLTDASQGKVSTGVSDWIDKICAQMACHGSIRAGQRLCESEIEALLKQLDEIDYSAHCPHGRPTTKVFPYSELAKWFHRL